MDEPHDVTAARLAALEAQVAALSAPTGLSASEGLSASDGLSASHGRRALLRRTGAVLAAGVAGAVALPGRAVAAAGEALLAGRGNDAGDATTSLTASGQGPVLELTGLGTTGASAAPALRLTASLATDGLDASTAQAGDLASSGDLLWYAHTSAAPAAPAATGAVYTSAFANHLEFLQEPRRVLDTRPGGPTDETGSPDDRRTRVVAGQFDTAGRLRAGSSLVLDLSGLVVGAVGVFANLTVVAPTGPGFLSAYPTADGPLRSDGLDRPAASSLNYPRGTSSLANFTLVRLGAGGRLSIYTTTTCHVLLDLTAVSVTEPFALSPEASSAGLRQQGQRLRQRVAAPRPR